VKKISVLLAILVCFFCLGLALVSCDDGSSGGGGNSDNGGGTLTLTNLPSELDGKFANFTGSQVFGCETADAYGVNKTLPKISNGKVIIKLWVYNEAGLQRYNGNDTIPWNYCDTHVYNKKDATERFAWIMIKEDITFSNGSAILSVPEDHVYIYE